QHVFEYGVVLKYARALERPDQAKACDFVWLEAIQQRVAVANFASRGLEKSGENVECGGLAGAVRANEADDFSVANREIEIGKGDEPAEMHRDMLDRKDHVLRCNACRHHCPPRDSELPAAIALAGLREDPAQFAMERSSAGTIPCGRTQTIAIITPPSRIQWTAGAAKGRRITCRKPKMIPPTIGPARVPLPPVITMITIVTV